jgi:mannan endo-1,4-beta-mannosidase
MSGEHNREASQGNFIQTMHDVTGHFPALWGGDFLYETDEIQNRPNVIQFLMQGWTGGAVISLMYHACPPTQGEACDWTGGVLSSLTDAQWSDLITDGGALNQVWKSRLDAIVPYFQQLKDAGMAALFRPQHEMNQGQFWWGGRPGPSGTTRLFQITHDYLVNTKGLDNIVWVWSVQDIWNSQDNSWDFDQYNPGDPYWDVMSLDFYDGNGYTTDKYNAMLAVAGNKPIAIGECQTLPTPGELTAQPRWVYFMGWSELVQQNNSNAAITATYTAASVLTQDGMPGW